MAAILLLALISACASAADPPGGAPDEQAPTIARSVPDSGAVLATPPGDINVWFDEVVSERIVGTPPEITSAVLLSPTTGEVRVGWHRDHISARPRAGFVAGRIYRLEVLPVLTDLRNNRLRTGRTIVFSTGPAIPTAVLSGALVDWVAGRPAPRTLVEATLLPDSLTYRTLTDSSGLFYMAQMPPGQYLMRGVMDTNGDRRFAVREAWDTVSVALDTARAGIELYAFTHDTTGPRLRLTEPLDSITLKLTFDRPLDTRVNLDTTSVIVALLADSTVPLALRGVYSQTQLDARQKFETDSIAAARAAADSAAAANDTTARRPATDSAAPTAARPGRPAPVPATPVRPVTPAIPGPGARPAPGARPGPGGARGLGRQPGAPPLDSTLAEKMVARRPPPTDIRFVKLAQALTPDTRYVVYVSGAASLSGNVGDARGQVRTPRPPAPRAGRPAPADSAARDSSVAPDSAAARDTSAAARPVPPTTPTRP